MIALLVMTDGRRDCIERAVPSALARLQGPITRRVIHDDSGDEVYRSWLTAAFPTFEVIGHPAGRQGFGGAIRTAWRHIGTGPERFVFHLEDDFTFNRPVWLGDLVEVLEYNPNLVQLALRRQPWNSDEEAAGGVVEQFPDAYVDRRMCLKVDGATEHYYDWLEHRLFFTTNPSLYRRSLLVHEWPDGEQSEGRFSHQLLVDPEVRFGFWGARDSGEWVTHIGHQRVGVGY